MAYTYRNVVQRPLTYAELDENFQTVDDQYTEALQAQDAATLNAGIYASTAAGLAATTNGQYFSVPSAGTDVYLDLYKNNAGSAVLTKTYYSRPQAAMEEIGSYSALNAYSGSASVFYVRGKASLFDGAAGVFRRDDTDTTSADNGGTVLVDAVGRRWKREFVGVVDVRWFGAKGDGASDDGPSIHSALAAIGLNGGGSLQFAAGGNHRIATTPKIPVNLSGALVIDGNGARITVAAGARCFDIAKIADHDILQNVTIKNLRVDATAMTGKNHVLLGTYENNAYVKRVGFKNITLRDIYIEGPDIDPTLVTHPLAVYLVAVHDADVEATQTQVENIRIENVGTFGCNAGYLVAGISIAGANANIRVDDVSIVNCWHEEKSAPPSFFSSSNVHIGQDALVGRVRVSGFRGKNSGDNSIEINNFESALVENCLLEGAFNVNVYVNNYNPNTNISAQNVVVKNVAAKVDGVRAFLVGTSNPLGAISFDQCTVIIPSSNNWSDAGAALGAGLSGTLAAFKSLNISSLTVTGVVSKTLASNVFPSCIFVRGSQNSSVSVRDIDIDISGSVTVGGFSFGFRAANCFGVETRYILDGMRLNYNVTGGTEIRGVSTGENTGDAINAELRGMQIDSNVVCRALVTASSGTLDSTHRITLVDCDLTGAGSTLPFTIGLAAHRPFVRMRNVRLSSHSSLSNIAPTGSPFEYQNTNLYPVTVTVAGGTVSAIELDAGSGSYTSTSLTAGTFRLANGDKIRVTYSSAPTMRAVHHWQD